MSVYLKLFLTFLEIGMFSFGGGYGMISVIREKCISNGWLTEEEIMNFIAVSESTPGPLAVNMATFVGSSQGGFIGALLATLGVVLPSFFIILIIAAIINNLMKFAGVQSALNGIKPVITALILATGAAMLLTLISGITTIDSAFKPDLKSLLILIILVTIGQIYRRIKKKAFSPILMIMISALLGIGMFGLI